MATELSSAQIDCALQWGLLKSLRGKSFCQTGAMSTTRARIDAIIVGLGGEVHNDVRAATDYLIIPAEDGFRRGSKYQAAIAKGKMVITEADFCAMILPTVEELLGDSDGSTGRTT